MTTRQGLPRLLRTVRSRARVTARLREIQPLTAWRERRLADLLGLDASIGLQALKIALSAGLSWALCQWVFDSPAPIYAPITAAFVALVTIRASLSDAIQRVLAVMLGIAVAIGAGEVFGLHAWSIGIIVGVGFLIGKMLRLVPGAAAQIPVTGLLLVGLGQGAGQAGTRVLDTLVGAAVAVIVNFALIPPNHVKAARRAADQLAQQVIDVLSELADGISRPWTRDEAAGWLRRARSGAGIAADAETSAETADESLRLHPNRATYTAPLHRAQRAVDTLRTVEIQTRVLARTLRDTADRHPTATGRQPPLPMADDLLTATAGAVAAFGRSLIVAEQHEPATDEAARTTLVRARERKAAIEADLEAMLEANLSRGIYLATLVIETGRILDELDSGLAPSQDGESDVPGSGPSGDP